MAIRHDHGVILRLNDFSESSQIAVVHTLGQGVVRVLAKGIRRSTRQRVAVGLDLLEAGELSFTETRGETTLANLTEWKQRAWFPRLRRRLPAIYAGLYAAELIPALTAEHDPSPAIHEALLALLTTLDGEPASRTPEPGNPPPPPPPDVAAATARFQAALLRTIGFAPNLRTCQGCGRSREPSGPAWFSSRAGGLICRACESGVPEKRRLPRGLLDPATGAARPGPWFDLLDYHLSHVAGRPFRTALALRRLLHARTPEAADEAT